jgi:hypothetical protein
VVDVGDDRDIAHFFDGRGHVRAGFQEEETGNFRARYRISAGLAMGSRQAIGTAPFLLCPKQK